MLMLGGCSGNEVYVASDTSLGINGSLNSAKTSGQVVIGYDRSFTAYVPLDEKNEDALSSYNCTEVEIKGIQLVRFTERMATGKAALNVAEGIVPEEDAKTGIDCSNRKLRSNDD
jgi:hypothetical protein